MQKGEEQVNQLIRKMTMVIIALGGVLCASTAPAFQTYSAVKIEGGTWVNSFNDAGQVVLTRDSSNGWFKASLWDMENGMRDLTTSGDEASNGTGINNVGQAVGNIKNIKGGYQKAVLWDRDNGLVNLGTLGRSSTAHDINDTGQVVGSSGTRDGETKAFIWDATNGMVDLGILGRRAYAFRVNNSGKVIGKVFTGTKPVHGFIWDADDGIRDIGTLSGLDDDYLVAKDINNFDQVVGWSGQWSSSEFETESAILWEEATGMIDLGSLGSGSARATGINDAGQVVGSSGNGDGKTRAFIWEAEQGMADLNVLANLTNNWPLREALAINNSGQILVKSGSYSYYLLTPEEKPYNFLGKPEAGELVLNHRPVRVEFDIPFKDPVVVAHMTTMNDRDPSVLRIYNVDSTGFTIQIQEYEYLDGPHLKETVNYMVMEAGSHHLTNGVKVEAGTFDTYATRNPFSRIALENAFEDSPVIITSVITKNGNQAVAGRVDNFTEYGFDFLLQEQEASLDNQYHVSETISYIAWEIGSGKVGDIRYSVGLSMPSIISSRPELILYDQPFLDSPILLADMQTIRGENTATLAVSTVSANGVEVWVQEEASLDKETTHTREIAGYIALSVE